MTLVLVTGGAGFIGSHLVEGLLAKGYRVRVLDSLIYGRREWVPPEAEFLKGDVADLATCREAMAGVAGVFHLAAMSRVIPSFDTIETCTRDNVLGTQNVLIAAREAGVRKIVYSGSSTFYGNQPAPHREYETPSEFLNIYGLTKQVGEQYCLLFDRHFGVPAVVLRYFNVYGPRQPQTGNYALVMGIFLRRWTDGNTLIIHGAGAQRRDFVHVRDVARANIMAFESERHGVHLRRVGAVGVTDEVVGGKAQHQQVGHCTLAQLLLLDQFARELDFLHGELTEERLTAYRHFCDQPVFVPEGPPATGQPYQLCVARHANAYFGLAQAAQLDSPAGRHRPSRAGGRCRQRYLPFRSYHRRLDLQFGAAFCPAAEAFIHEKLSRNDRTEGPQC